MTLFQSAHGQVAVRYKYSSSETGDRIIARSMSPPRTKGGPGYEARLCKHNRCTERKRLESCGHKQRIRQGISSDENVMIVVSAFWVC